MPSKKSKNPSIRLLPWKVVQGFSEAQVEDLARTLASEIKAGINVILEGEMGAGKSTFARALIRALGVHQPAEGSPTFSIAHEYRSERLQTDVIHIDLYRMKNEYEIEEAGIASYFWERGGIVLIEWLSNFPEFEAEVKKQPYYLVSLRVSESSPELRNVEIYAALGAAEKR